MKRALFTGATVLMTMSSVAFAQTNPTPAPATAASAPLKAVAIGVGIREELTTNLQKSGFTDVKCEDHGRLFPDPSQGQEW